MGSDTPGAGFKTSPIHPRPQFGARYNCQVPKGFVEAKVEPWSGHPVTVSRKVRVSDGGLTAGPLSATGLRALAGTVVDVTATSTCVAVTTHEGHLLHARPLAFSSFQLAALESESKARPCPACGTAIAPLATGRQGRRPVYCSQACRKDPNRLVADRRRENRNPRPCAGCSEIFAPTRSDQMCCSNLCWHVARGHRLLAPIEPRRCAFSDCGAEFAPKSRRQLCCSEPHGKAYWRERAREAGYKNPKQPWGGAKKEADQRRRAMKLGASTTERVVAAEIMERDGWRCGLCRKKIDKRLKWPHPRSASIDHIVPLTRGGAHSPANVQAACLVCNTAKSNNGGGEQLALIG